MAKKVQNLVEFNLYGGSYVALDGKKVIAYGHDVGVVIDRARKLGHKIPTVVYVPKKNE